MKKYKNFEAYLKAWREQNKDKVKIYNLKSFVRQFIEIKKSGLIEELGLQEIDLELSRLYQGYNQGYNLDYKQENKQEKKESVLGIEISKNPDDYVSYEEASRLLGIKQKNLWKPIKKGFLRKIPKSELGIPGKGFMILREDIEKYKKYLKREREA